MGDISSVVRYDTKFLSEDEIINYTKEIDNIVIEDNIRTPYIPITTNQAIQIYNYYKDKGKVPEVSTIGLTSREVYKIVKGRSM